MTADLESARAGLATASSARKRLEAENRQLRAELDAAQKRLEEMIQKVQAQEDYIENTLKTLQSPPVRGARPLRRDGSFRYNVPPSWPLPSRAALAYLRNFGSCC
eukprot:6186835-Pleurochrysis_carterae.AAC.4